MKRPGTQRLLRRGGKERGGMLAAFGDRRKRGVEQYIRKVESGQKIPRGERRKTEIDDHPGKKEKGGIPCRVPPAIGGEEKMQKPIKKKNRTSRQWPGGKGKKKVCGKGGGEDFLGVEPTLLPRKKKESSSSQKRKVFGIELHHA